MARADRGPSFAQRVAAAGLSPQQRETSAATLLLAELVHEMTERLDEQTKVLEEIRDGRAVTYNITNAPSGPDEGKGGGGDVHLREPAVPPPDPDDDPDTTRSGGAVAAKATGKPAAGRPAAKATAGKAPAAAKTTQAARRSTGRG